MNTASLAMKLLPGWLIYTLLYAIIIKAVERRLRLVQSLLLSTAASVTWIVLIVAYQVARAALPASSLLDILAMLLVCCAAGTVVTRIARRYAIEKQGRLGLGAKANLWFALIGLVLAPAVMLAITYFK